MNKPNYKIIYLDLLENKYPNKLEACESILNKKKMSTLDIIEINKIIFKKTFSRQNQALRSYNEDDIIKILEFQKINKMNNCQLANHFKLSRNTVSKWKKMFKY